MPSLRDLAGFGTGNRVPTNAGINPPFPFPGFGAPADNVAGAPGVPGLAGSATGMDGGSWLQPPKNMTGSLGMPGGSPGPMAPPPGTGGIKSPYSPPPLSADPPGGMFGAPAGGMSLAALSGANGGYDTPGGSGPNPFSPGQFNAPTNPNWKGQDMSGSIGAGMGKYFPGSHTGANGSLTLGQKGGKFDYAAWKADQDANKVNNPDTGGFGLPAQAKAMGQSIGWNNAWGNDAAAGQFLQQQYPAFQASLAGKSPQELQQMYTELQSQAGPGFTSTNQQGAELTMKLAAIQKAINGGMNSIDLFNQSIGGKAKGGWA